MYNSELQNQTAASQRLITSYLFFGILNCSVFSCFITKTILSLLSLSPIRQKTTYMFNLRLSQSFLGNALNKPCWNVATGFDFGINRCLALFFQVQRLSASFEEVASQAPIDPDIVTRKCASCLYPDTFIRLVNS